MCRVPPNIPCLYLLHVVLNRVKPHYNDPFNIKSKKVYRMSFKKLILLTGLCVLFAGCSTGRYGSAGMTASGTPTEMGTRYLLGRGVQQNDEKAFYYFNQAAQEDDAFAQNEVAYMYAAGKGTAKDYTKAFEFYEKAANHGLASAQYNLGFMYLHGLGTQANKEQAMIWFRKSAAHGFEPAQMALARNKS